MRIFLTLRLMLVLVAGSFAPALGQTGIAEYDACIEKGVAATGHEVDRVIFACSRLTSDSGLTQAIRSKAHIARAKAYVSKNDIDSAIADLNEAIRLESTNAHAYLVRSRLYMRENNRRALADSSEAIRLSPLDPQGYVFKMQVYMDMYRLLGVKVAPARVDEMVPDGPAAKSGFEVGDVIVGIDEQKIESFADVQRIVAGHANRQLTFQIIRGGATTELKATPDRREISDRYGNKLQVGVIGIRRNPLAQEAEYKRYQPDESDMKDYDDAIADLTEAIRRNVDFSSIREKGHKEVAIGDFRKAISMGPGPDTKQELQKMLQVLGVAP